MNLPTDKMDVNNTIASYGLINLQFELKPTTQLTGVKGNQVKHI